MKKADVSDFFREILGNIILALVVTTLFGVFFCLDMIRGNHPGLLPKALGILASLFIFRAFNQQQWLNRMDCWFQSIEEIPRPDEELNLIVKYNLDGQPVTFYGKQATPDERKVIALPPLKMWTRYFPEWVTAKRQFIVKVLAQSYRIEWNGTDQYSIISQPPESYDPTETGETLPEFAWTIGSFSPGPEGECRLTAEETNFRLEMTLQSSGGDFLWVGDLAAFETWTGPEGEPISELKRRQLLSSLAKWCRERQMPIRFIWPLNYFWRAE